jgi:hypothetical protein
MHPHIARDSSSSLRPSGGYPAAPLSAVPAKQDSSQCTLSVWMKPKHPAQLQHKVSGPRSCQQLGCCYGQSSMKPPLSACCRGLAA